MNYLSPHEEGPQPEIRYRRASEIQPEKIDWLWSQRLPRGEFILYAGLPGVGKSMLSLDVAARITTGEPWPDGSGSPDVGNVAILTHEDDPARTIIPRLQTLGADLDRVWIIDGFGYEDDPERHELFLHRDGIDALRRSIDVDLLVVDTCKSYMTGDLNKAADVARGLRPLIDWAHETKTTIIGIEHLGKANDRGAMQRILGSTALVGQCRFAWVFSRDLQNPDRLLMTRAKGNIAKDVGGLSCRLVADLGDDHPKVIWDSDPVNMTADEALAPPEKKSDQRSKAEAFLIEQFGEGMTLAADFYAAAQLEGITDKTLRAALRSLGGTTSKSGFRGRTEWHLPNIPNTGESLARLPPLEQTEAF